MISANIFNIQRFSIHDGPGIRTTVFFKGCPLKCMWCHNPESWKEYSELLYDVDKCVLCLECVESCEKEAIFSENKKIDTNPEKCTACGKCSEVCLNSARTIAGKKYNIKDLIRIIEKDRVFYEKSGGGATFSGGEPLLKIDFLTESLKALKERGIHTAVDTSGFVPWKNIDRIIPYTDLFLYDLKTLNRENHIKYTGQDNSLILENLKNLKEKNAVVRIRIPLVGGVNDGNEDINLFRNFLEIINPEQIDILPCHNIAKGKNRKIISEISVRNFKRPEDRFINKLIRSFEEIGLKVVLGG